MRGELAEMLGEEEADWLREQREGLVKAAKDTIHSQREIDYFTDALAALRDEALQSSNDDNGDVIDNIDYETVLPEKMKEIRDARSGMELDLEEEEVVLTLRKALGESVASSAKKEPDDDELELVEPTMPAGQDLQCPFLGKLLEEPLKNNICQHVYSRRGLQSYLKSRGRSSAPCPIPGCANRNITANQCLPDMGMKMKVKRYQRGLAANKEKLSQRAIDIDGDDDDDDDDSVQ